MILLILILGGVFIIAVSIVRYRRSETRAFALAIAVAAERGIPLTKAISAFASDTSSYRNRATKLVELLEEGIELPQAIMQSGIVMPYEVRTALEYGNATGDLGPTLRHVIAQNDSDNARLGPIIEKFAYVIGVVFVGFGILTFIMLKIVPVFDRMFMDFGLELPVSTLLLIEFCRRIADWFPILLVLGVVAIILIFTVFQRRFLGPTMQAQTATLLRILSLTVQREGSFVATLSLLSVRHPHPQMRRRIDTALSDLNEGAKNWCDSLHDAGLLRTADVAVLRSAERVGNLPWALDEMADSRMRRTAYRSAAVLNLAFPTIVSTLGIVIGMVAYALMAPLASLILDLS